MLCRSRFVRGFVAAVALATASGSGSALQTATAPDASPVARPADPLGALDAGATLFQDVHVVAMDQPGVRSGWSVLVADGRIVEMGPRESVKPGPERGSVRVVECGGSKWLIPGLVDMHVHLPPYEQGNEQQEAAAFRACALLIANGVTTARGMVGHPSQTRLREDVVTGKLLGPALHLAGAPIHQGVAKTPDEAAALVRAQHEQGFDFIKSHRVVVPEVYRAVQTTAAEIGLPVAGHVDNEVGLDVALEFSQQLEHLDAIPAALLKDPEAAATFGQIPPGPIVDALQMERLPAIAKKIASKGAWCVPTLALFEGIVDQRMATAALMARPEMKYVVGQAVGQWAEQRNATKFPVTWGAGYGQRVISLRAKITRSLADAGVGLMAGSDSPQFFKVTGFALHDEIESLGTAGLSGFDALRCATANPARYMAALPNRGSSIGIEPDFGTIEIGKRADLVLLDADPLKDLAATRRIDAVMVRGKLLDRSELDDLLTRVHRSARPIFEPGQSEQPKG